MRPDSPTPHLPHHAPLPDVPDRKGPVRQAGVPRKRFVAFQNATGTLLIQQYADMEQAMRIAQGIVRERDRIAAIVAPTEQAWAVAGHLERRQGRAAA